MTSYAIITGQRQQTWPTGPTPSQVVVSGAPTLGHVSIAVAGPNVGGAQASLWCQTATSPFGYTQWIPLVRFYIAPGAPQSQQQDVALGDLEYSQFLFGQVDQIDGSGLTSVSMSMVV